MQRFESFGLRGTRQPGPSPILAAAVGEQMLRRALDGMKHHRAPVSPPPPPRARAPRRQESRPAVNTVTRGGTAHLGGHEFMAAVRTVRDAPEWELRAAIEADPVSWAQAAANLARLSNRLRG
jgi:hypothetical protein